MKLNRLIEPLEARKMRCPICNRKFEETTAPAKTKRGAPIKVSEGFQIKKKSIVLLNLANARTDIALSAVNNSARVRYSSVEDRWEEKKITILCENIRHSFSLILKFGLNKKKLETREYELIEENFRFRNEGKTYRLKLDYTGNQTLIYDPSISTNFKTKPSIMMVVDKPDIIQKIDRLFNFQ